MTFEPNLQESLRDCSIRIPLEFAHGQTLEKVLDQYLLAAESSSDNELRTSILLLTEDGKRLWHGSAPNLPPEYCRAINGSEIGPSAGSCGTAAFEGRAVYVTDIATDPRWSAYRHLALPHGLRACWSTPIFDKQGVVLGTFAIYHLAPRSPTRDEVKAITLITGHVASAIDWFRHSQDNGASPAGMAPDQAHIATKPDKRGTREQDESGIILRSIASDFDQLAGAIQTAIDQMPDTDANGLKRAKQAAEHGAKLARKGIVED